MSGNDFNAVDGAPTDDNRIGLDDDGDLVEPSNTRNNTNPVPLARNNTNNGRRDSLSQDDDQISIGTSTFSDISDSDRFNRLSKEEKRLYNLIINGRPADKLVSTKTDASQPKNTSRGLRHPQSRVEVSP